MDTFHSKWARLKKKEKKKFNARKNPTHIPYETSVGVSDCLSLLESDSEVFVFLSMIFAAQVIWQFYNKWSVLGDFFNKITYFT